MGIERNVLVGLKHFSGLSKTYSAGTDGLADILRSMLINPAAAAVAGGSITALTDTSGGSDGSTIALATMPVETDIEGGVLGATAASCNTAIDTVGNAYSALTQQLNLVYAELALGAIEEGEGTATLPTIAAIDDTVSANGGDTDSVLYSGLRTAFQELLDNQATIAEAINVTKRAVGQAELVVAAGAGAGQGEVRAGLDQHATHTDTADSADPPNSSALRSEIDAFLDVLSDNVAYFATELDLVTAITAGTAVTHVAG